MAEESKERNVEEINIESLNAEELNADELEDVAGGRHGKVGLTEGRWLTVRGIKPGTYLAVRSKPAYDYHNEIGCLYNGDSVQVVGNSAYTGNSYDPLYTWIWTPRLNISGWVNSRFIG